METNGSAIPRIMEFNRVKICGKVSFSKNLYDLMMDISTKILGINSRMEAIL